MKKYFAALLLLCLTCILPAQQVLEDNDIAQNWTLTDINGQSHTLYDELNQNKVVVLFFFDASVSPCWTYHTTNALQDLHTQYGAGGKDSVRVFYIESNLSTSVNNIHGNLDSGQPAWMVTGDYTQNNPVPIINLEAANSQIFTDYRLADYPLVITICPERVIKISGLRTMAQHVEFYNDSTICQRQCDCDKDLATLKYYGPNNLCSDHVFHPKVLIQNLGHDTIYHFDVIIDYYGSSYAPTTPVYRMADTTFDMALAPFDTMLIIFDTYYLHDPGKMKVYTLLTPNNADKRPDNSAVYYSMHESFSIPEVDTSIVFKLNTDQYGEEIIWNLKGSSGNILMTGGPYANLPDTGVVTHTFPLHLEKGECYKITIFDTFGDGICCDNGHGSYQLINSDGTIIEQGGQNFIEKQVQFRAHDPNFNPTALQLFQIENIDIYPNPAYSDLIINLPYQPKQFVAEMIDINGKIVKMWESDRAKQFIDVTDINAGIYLLNIISDGKYYTQKIAIIH